MRAGAGFIKNKTPGFRRFRVCERPTHSSPACKKIFSFPPFRPFLSFRSEARNLHIHADFTHSHLLFINLSLKENTWPNKS